MNPSETGTSLAMIPILDLRSQDIRINIFMFGWMHPWAISPLPKSTAKKNNLNFDDYWVSNENAEAYHIIGKDIVYFHTLFWPALLKAADFRTPTSVWVHGHIMVNGEKMSKSKGTYLSAKVYLDHLDPMYLRYYFASKISNSMDDIDFNLEDFEKRVNSDLIGKITNLASRGAQMLGGKLDGVLSDLDQDGLKMVLRAQQKGTEIASYYENREFVKAINEIRALADEANRYFDEKAPWKTLESSPAETKMVLTSTLNLFRLLAIYLKPILPEYAQNVEKLFNEEPYSWNSIERLLANRPISKYSHLATRIDPLKIKAMMESNKKELAEKAERDRAASQNSKPAAAVTKTATAPPQEIEISTFDQVDLRIAQIVKAESVEGADKLLRLEVNLGPLGNRQIFAGIKSAYSAETLTGKLVVVVANLKPRKMKFGMSEGMALAASDPDPKNSSGLFLVSPDSGAKPGDKVK
jgi:methionyl-tRNA synthetase